MATKYHFLGNLCELPLEEDEEESEEEKPQFFYCDACGIQLKSNSDRGGGKADNTWCKDCSNEDGSHKNRSEIKDNIKKLLTGPDGYYTTGGQTFETEEELDDMAEAYLKKTVAFFVEEKKEDED